jgi:hypothetical protein
MDVLALCISVVSLIVSFAAYRRSAGARRDLHVLERASADKAERSRSTAQSSADTDAAAVRAAYERDLQTIADLRAHIAALGKEALEEIRQDLKSVRQRVDRLAERAAREIKELQDEARFSLIEYQVGLRLAVDDAVAHLKAIEAKRDLVLARLALLRGDWIDAAARIEAAATKIADARALALGHHENFDALLAQARTLLVALRTGADTTRASINALLARTDDLLQRLSDEGAASRSAA